MDGRLACVQVWRSFARYFESSRTGRPKGASGPHARHSEKQRALRGRCSVNLELHAMRPQETSARPRCTGSPPKKTTPTPGGAGGGVAEGGGAGRRGMSLTEGVPERPGGVLGGPRGVLGWASQADPGLGGVGQIREVLGESCGSLGGSRWGRGIPEHPVGVLEGSWKVVTRKVRNPTTVLHRLDCLRKQRVQIQSCRAVIL